MVDSESNLSIDPMEFADRSKLEQIEDDSKVF